MPLSHLYLLNENLALCKIATYTAFEPPSALGLYRPSKLASTSYSVSLGCLYEFVSEEDDTEQLGGFFVDVDK